MINLILAPYAWGRNGKPLLWSRHGVCFIFHVHNLECIIDFWKRWVADGESFFILRFTYEYNLIYVSPLFLSLIQEELKLQQLAKTKSKIHIQHPPMIWTHIWKIKGHSIKIFNCFLFRKLYIGCKTTKNFGKFERLHWKWLHSHPSSLNNMHVLHYVIFIFPVIY